MISRVAESCFWLNRYLERAESLARLLQVNLAFQLDVKLPDAERWRPLVVVTGNQELFETNVRARSSDDAEVVQEFLVWSEENPSSIYSSLRWARENARTMRETISLEMWETINHLWLWIRQRKTRNLYGRNRDEFYRHVRDQCVLFHGFAQSTMLHDEALYFMRLGTALERADQTARILDLKHHSLGPDEDHEMPAEIAQWLAILRTCCGSEPFFKRAEHALSGRDVAEFLLLDPLFPRSVLHNLDRSWNFLELLRTQDRPHVGEQTAKRLGDLRSTLARAELDALFERGIHDVLTQIVKDTAEVCQAVHDDFFDPPFDVQPSRAKRRREAEAS